MTVIEKVLATWSAVPAAVALVPASRFKPADNWQGLDRPYILQIPVASTPTVTHANGGASVVMRKWNYYQLSVIADSTSSAVAICEMCKAVFNGNNDGVQFVFQGWRFQDKSEETRTVLYIVELTITEALS